MSVKLRPYTEYKDPGVPWLGRVPSDWDVVRLKHASDQIVCGATPASSAAENWDGDIVWATPADVGKSRWLRDSQRQITDAGLASCSARLVPRGSIILTCRAPIGGVALAAMPLCTSQGCKSIIPNASRLHSVFGFYLMGAMKHHLQSLGSGTTFPEISTDVLAGTEIPIPPLHMQRQIAAFLTRVDLTVRRLIRAKHRQIELLNEQKQVIINRAVTRGLDPNVRLKPSGVEWLGDIPEHWEVVALGVRYWVQLGKMLDAKKITGDYLVPYLRNADVQWDRVNSDNLPMMDICEHEYERYLVQPGDLLVCEGGDIGRSAFWNGSLPRCGYQKALHRLRPRDTGREYPRFLFYVMFAASRQGVFVADGSENTIAHLTAEKLRHHRFAFPSMEEQQHIACYLDVGTAGLTMAAEKVQQEIDLLREYRTRLIADVVTGKLDVRGVELPDLEDADIAYDLGDSGFNSDTDQDDLPDAEEVEADDED